MFKKIFFSSLILFILFILFLIFSKPVSSIQDVNVTPEISIVDEDGTEIMHYIANHKTTPIELDKVNQKCIDILLNIEDKSFYKHSGFNLNRIFKTIISNIKKNQSHGASTITQQYIKNVYLSNEKSLARKLKELYYAIKLEQATSKDEILAGYLNCIYLGNDIYGIANASKYYFNKSYTDLTIQEMTTFVALLNAPTYYSNHLDELETKKNKLLKILLENTIITQEEYDIAIAPIQFHYNTNIYDSNLLFYVDGVIREYKALNLNPKFNQIVTIKTKYSPSINKNKFRTSANYAAIAVDKKGYILSMMGDKDYYTSSFNIATQGKRDIGSTIKPILYYEALKCGFTTSTTYYSAPYSFTYHNEKITINNYGGSYPYKSITMREALATSDNIYAIKTHQAIGFKTLANHFKHYDIEAKGLPSLALGSVGMSLYDLTRIYSQFFTEGTYLEFRYIEYIHMNQQKVYSRIIKKEQFGENAYFAKIKNLMASTFDPSIPHATGSSLSQFLKTKCYGKSGLTDFDSYMMGFNEDVLIGVWSGYLDNSLLEDATVKRLPKDIFLNLINAYEKKSSETN